MKHLAEARAGLHAGILAAMQALTHGMIAFAMFGAAGVAFGMAAALAASMVAGLAIALFGASRPLIGNTSAATALITASLLAAAEPAGLGEAIALAMLLAGLAGAMMLLLAATRLARLAALVPTPVTQGLGNAIALLVVLAQAPLVLGAAPGEAAPWLAPAPGAIAVAAVAWLLILRPVPVLPAPLVALAAGGALHHVLGQGGIATGPVLGLVPTGGTLAHGLLSASLPGSIDALPLLSAASSLALLATIETMAAAAVLRETSARRGDPDRDLRGAALAMLGGAATGGMAAVAQGLATIACWRAGGRGRAAQLWRLPVPLTVLLAAGGVLAALPFAALAGMLCGAVVRLVQVPPSPFARGPGQARRAGDVLVVLSVMAAALVFGLVAAVGAGVLLAVLIFTASMAQSPVRRVTRNPVGRSRIRRPAEQERLLRHAGETIALIELEGPIFFGSAERVLQRAEAEHAAGATVLILDLGRVTRMDLSGGRRLLEVCGIAPGRVLLAPLHPGSRAAEELEALGLTARLPPDAVCADLPAAVEVAEAFVLAAVGGDEAASPGTPRAALEALGMPPSAADHFLGLSAEHRFAPGAPILRRGNPADAAYLLLSGEVLISLPAGEGRPSTRLAVLVPGVLFGESALLGQMQRSADATARGEVRCLRLDAAAAERLRAEAPDVAWHLMAMVARQLSVQVRAASATIDRLEA